MYLAYNDYTSKGGTLTSAEFTRIEYKAEMFIDTITFGRVKEMSPVPTEVAMLTFELCKVGEAEDIGGAITSVSNDGYSESYAVVSNEEKSMVLAAHYLSSLKTAEGIPVLWRGVDDK